MYKEVLLLLFLFGCSAPNPIPEYTTFENFLAILSELQRHLDEDVYRFPLAQDPSGQNLFKSTLVRLDNYQKLYPERFKELIAYSRAICHQKLGNFSEAALYFRETEKYEGELASKAQKDLLLLGDIQTILNLKPSSSSQETIVTQIDLFERREHLFEELIKKYQNASVAETGLIWREAERNSALYAEFLFQHRFQLKEGTRLSLEAKKKVALVYKESSLVLRHQIALANCLVTLAEEYVLFYPSYSVKFNKEEFNAYIQPAMEIYRLVGNRDGEVEKIEAQGRLVALNAFLRQHQEIP